MNSLMGASKNQATALARTLQRDANGHPKDAKPGPVRGSSVDHTQRKSARQLGEVCRAAHGPEELQRVLWSIFAGIDPFAEERAAARAERSKARDGVPEIAESNGEIDWKHRMKAGDMWAQYAFGKPLAGVVVEAMIQTQSVNVNIDAGPIDPKALPGPMRDMMRALALAALGREPEAVAAVPTRPGASLARARGPQAPRQIEGVCTESDASGSSAVDLSDLGALDMDGGRLGRDGVALGQVEGVAHDPSIGRPAENVKGSAAIRIDFRQSTNLVSAELRDGICSVTFRVKTGVGPTFRYANVTAAMMQKWREAESAGAWFAREIRARHQQFPVVGRDTPSVTNVTPGGTEPAALAEVEPVSARGGAVV